MDRDQDGYIVAGLVELHRSAPLEMDRGCLPGGTGCYSATLPGPLIRNGDPGCYTGCYKVLRRVLHFAEFQRKRV